MEPMIQQPDGPAASAPRGRPPRIDPARDALFLDLDGTLAPISPRPQDVGPDPRRTALLRELGERLGGRVAVVTGRDLEDADRILEGASPVIAAVHGLILRGSDGALSRPEATDALSEAIRDADAFARNRDGLLLEPKSVGFTLHFRAAPHLAEETRRFGQALAQRLGLHGQPGDRVFEIRLPGRNKGDAVRALMDQQPFRGRRPVFVGDDLTDEDGVAAAQALGGYGVLVGNRPGSAADHRLADVADVMDWLAA